MILAASIVGTGELINTTSLGAKAGFSLLWLILLSCVIKVFVQIELGRYAITHGQTTLAAFDTLPGPRLGVSWLCWLWLIMMLTTQAQIAAMEGTVGQAAHMAFPGASRAIAASAGRLVPSWGLYLSDHQEHVWAAVTTLAAILLLLSGGYRRLERITTVLVAAVTLFTVASVLILQWTCVPYHPSQPGTWVRAGHSRHRRGAGVLGVRHHGRRRRRAIRVPLLVHRERLRTLRGSAKCRRRLGPSRAGVDAGDAARCVDQHAGLHDRDRRFLLFGGGGPSSPGPRPQGPRDDTDSFAMYLQPLEGTVVAPFAPSRTSASCWGPGPYCSRRSMSPRPPIAA